MKWLTFVFALIFPLFMAAQTFQETFSDGDFTNNPTWLGDTANFTIFNFPLGFPNHPELRLDAPSSGISQMYVPVATTDSSIWEFYFRMDFEPSSSNQLKVFLSTNNNDFNGNLDGYFLQIGESGSSDAIEIYKQTGNATTLLFRGTDAAVAAQPAEASIKITRNNNGNWEVFADYSGGNNYTSEGTFSDNTHTSSSYFGFWTKYTSTRVDKFYFDNIEISPLFQDVVPPVVDTVVAVAADTLEVKFNEFLDGASIQASDFTVLSLGNVASANLDAADASLVRLTLPFSLSDATNYTLEISNITDVNGNNLALASKSFAYYDIQMPVAEEILINEIMADPTPSVGLPEVEFLELYNHSSKSFLLSDVVFLNSGNAFNLPERLFLAGEYVILCDDDDVAALSNFGNVVGINGFSALANSGDDLKIENIHGETLHEVNYTDDWYQDDTKKSGGYTLELQNPTLVCVGAANWSASNAPTGGTPNAQNSIFDDTPDTQAPTIVAVDFTTDSVLMVTFSENIDSASAANSSNYELDFFANGPDSVQILNATQVKLFFPSTLTEAYNVLTVRNVADCLGNAIFETSFGFQYYDFQEATTFDILMTEIFADPTPSFGLPNVEYVELYNRSDKVLNLRDFVFENRSTSTVLTDFTLLPNEYVVLHEENLFENFDLFGNRIALENLPSLNNSSDELKLYNPDGELIDFVNYSSEWYGNPNYTEGGRSLEMISTRRFCENASNWAASLSQWGGTPGFPNAIAQDILDENPPIAERAFPISPTEIDVFFNEKLSIEEAENPANYTISNSIMVIDALLDASFQKVTLTLSSPLEAGQTYTISIQTNFQDCIGNATSDIQTILVGLPANISPLDIRINEILFNPEVGGSDFLELYNSSGNILNLKDLKISNAENGQLQSLAEIDEDFLFFPNTYLAISENPTDVRYRYLDSLLEMPATLGFLIKNDLPSFPDDAGEIVLLNANSEWIDHVEYFDDWHHPLLANEDGVSLERIDIFGNSADENNWQSAASTVGYATPAYQNSQYLDNSAPSSNEISLTKKAFSPDDDGFEDFLLINYNLSSTDVVANISIYDANGRPIRQLTQNQTLDTTGSLKWDGTTDDGTRAKMGIYIVFVELTQTDGQVKREKLTCVLAGRL